MSALTRPDRCRSCAHYRDAYPELDLGECNRLVVTLMANVVEIGMQHDERERVERFIVSPDFGCVLHEDEILREVGLT